MNKEALYAWIFPGAFKLILIVLIAIILRYLIDVAMQKYVKKALNSNRAETLRQIVDSISDSIIFTIVLMMVLNEFGIDIRPIIASAGILGVAFGLGAQHLMKDVINGFLILLEEQYVIGDIIKVGEISGTVEKLNLRTTILKDASGSIHIIPNSSVNQVTVVKKS